MSADVATHKDIGIVTEAELARRKRDVRGRAGSVGFSEDAQRADEEAIESGDAHHKPVPANETFKHLPGKHNQQAHGHGGAQLFENGKEPARTGVVDVAGVGQVKYEYKGKRTEDEEYKGVTHRYMDFVVTLPDSRRVPVKFHWSDRDHTGEFQSGTAGFKTFDGLIQYLDAPRKKSMSEELLLQPLIEKFIRKKGSQWCVVSKKGKNLGCESSHKAAVHRLQQVEWFKRHKSLTDEQAAAGLDSGELQVLDAVLKSWLDLEEKRAQFKSAVVKHFPSAPCPECGSTAIDEHVGRGTHKCKECGHEYQPQEEKALFNAQDLKAKGQEVLGRYLTEAELLNPELVQAAARRLIVVGNEGGQPAVKELRDWLVKEKHLPGIHDQSSHAGGNTTSLGGANTELLAGKLLGKDAKQVGQNSYEWSKRGGYADAKFKSVKAAIEKLGFKQVGGEGSSSQADEGSARFGDVWEHPDGYRVSFGSFFGGTSGGNRFRITVSGVSEEKHLPGKHNQESHAGGMGGGEKGEIPFRYPKSFRLRRNKIDKLVEIGHKTNGDLGKALKIFNERYGKNLQETPGLRDLFEDEFRSSKADVLTAITQEEKHLPGQHDQSSHAGMPGAAGKVAHTPAQLRDAAARQHAKDEGISIAAAKKKVGTGAKVPTTRVGKPEENEYADWDEAELETQKIGIERSLEGYRIGARGGFAHMTPEDISEAKRNVKYFEGQLKKIKQALGKSLVTKADQTCLKSTWGQYYKYYSGKWIAAAWGLYQKGQYAQAAQAFAKARDGFQPNKNPGEYKCLDGWKQDAEGKGEGEQKAGTSAGSRKGHQAMGHKVDGVGAEVGATATKGAERRNDLKLVQRKMEQRGREYDASNQLYEDAKAKGTTGPELDKLFNEAKTAWEAYADARKGFSAIKYSKSLVTKAEMAERQPVRFAAPMVNWDWAITKARTLPDGTMEWTATTTKFARDVQRDLVRRAFYEEAIARFKSKVVPPPFVSVAHYRASETCLDCGHVYKSLYEYICPTCKAERVLAGICTDMWIDGQQPKARGRFYPTEVGRAAFESVLLDIRKSLPADERNRVSMGFYPDVPDGIIYSDAGRDFIKGWCEHFALTRVPVVAETDITARMVH